MSGQRPPSDRPWGPRTEAEVSPSPATPATRALGALEPGTVVDRYVVEGPLGRGGMARVFGVRHQRLGTRHALKILDLPTTYLQARTLREGRVQASLRHPNVVAVTDVIEVNGAPGLIMELVEGPTLSDLAHKDRPPLDEALALGRQVLLAVAAAHAAGVIHRDLKPSNVLVATTPEGRQAKVADFGLVKLLEGATLVDHDGMPSTRSGQAMGTPGYMAPEQIRDAAHVDARADVFALGALLYALLTGEPAFAGSDPNTLFQAVFAGHHRPAREHCPELSPALERLLSRCLSVDPDDRPADAGALLVAFDAAIAPAEPPPAPQPPSRRRLPRWLLTTAVAALGLGVATPVLVRFLHRAPASPSVTLTRLPAAPGLAQQPALSPDGTRIVFSDGQDLFLSAVDGTQQVNLTAHLDPAATGPAFSPDGTTLAFSAGGTLYQGGPAGDTPRPLAVQGHDPAYSPDGRGLAYTTRATGPDGRITASDSELWLLDLDRGAPRALLRDLNPQMPAFSPDGHFLVFVGGEGGWSAPGLWVIPATGGETRRLGDAEGFSPVWSDARIWFLAQQGDATVLLCLPMAGGDPSPSGPVTEVARVPGSDGGSLAMAAQGGGLVLATIRSGEAAPTTDLWWVEVGR